MTYSTLNIALQYFIWNAATNSPLPMLSLNGVIHSAINAKTSGIWEFQIGTNMG